MLTNSFDFIKAEESISLKKSWESFCFACSSSNDLGLKLSFNLHKPTNRVFSEFNISKNFCGFEKIVHGGIIATILDEIAGWTLISNTKKAGFTREAQIKYNKPVPSETDLLAIGEIITNKNERTFTIESKICSLDGVCLGEMVSIWVSPTIDQLVKITGKSAEYYKSRLSDFEVRVNNMIQ